MRNAGFFTCPTAHLDEAARTLLEQACMVASTQFPKEYLQQGLLSVAIQALVKIAAVEHGLDGGDIADGLAGAVAAMAAQSAAAEPAEVIGHIARKALMAADQLRDIGVSHQPLVRQ